jgi:uncharacterized protein YkwD
MAAARRRSTLTALAATLVTSAAIATPNAGASTCPGADLTPSAASIGTATSATLCLLNEQRAAAGLAPLTSEPLLTSVATQYSQSMVDGRFFSHVSPDGVDLEQRLAAYVPVNGGWLIGENIAWGEGSSSTPAFVVDGWMHSAGHRANILQRGFREIGIGIVNGTPRGSAPATSATYTTDFGARDGAGATSPGAATLAPAPGATSPASEIAAASLAPAASQPRKRISEKRKRRITAQCTRIASRKHLSKSRRKESIARCVRTKIRAAGLRP